MLVSGRANNNSSSKDRMGIKVSKEQCENKYLDNIIKVADLPNKELRFQNKKLKKLKRSKSWTNIARHGKASGSGKGNGKVSGGGDSNNTHSSLSTSSSTSSLSSILATTAGNGNSTLHTASIEISSAQQLINQQQRCMATRTDSSASFSTTTTTTSTSAFIQSVSNNDTSETLLTGFSHLPDIVQARIIKMAVGSIFPTRHFSNTSAVCRAWWRMAFKSISTLYYHFPYIYERDRDIRRCKLMARWLSATNHYDMENQITTASLGFGFDTSGFCMLYTPLLQCRTLKNVRVTFYQKQVSTERIKAICDLVATNTNIKRLDMSRNSCPKQAIHPLAQVLNDGVTCLRELIWRDSLLDSQHFAGLMEGIVRSQISHINFSGNSIDSYDDQRMSTIISLISQPSKLVSVDLSHNFLGLPAIERLIVACRKTNRIRRLKLVGNTISEEEANELRYNLEKRSSSEKLKVVI
ncbi:hypothetical protein SAMD00019534_100660 [Acytostelium subglobosum LB1]|uniref:hypothetical protein n=1 Tax=Acytostelium subglobosum LB1 TaxID=1410327 RepID=UPI00064505C8|nr:hypothetical protein SAMD00019534_100660 [Acytostelium subglobosum LB1]GAM26891.1 hypothetical protein SAMD00019534_100660 [Acytostelium subglobosum LB1]|eukprot:XP_012750159.1 hypothetical protein SAMD00019534_100660 [Acytostelium subglobosum LB1]